MAILRRTLRAQNHGPDVGAVCAHHHVSVNAVREMLSIIQMLSGAVFWFLSSDGQG